MGGALSADVCAPVGGHVWPAVWSTSPPYNTPEKCSFLIGEDGAYIKLTLKIRKEKEWYMLCVIFSLFKHY